MKIRVFNPDIKDFTVKYDVSGDRNTKEFKVNARDVAYFDKSIAFHVANHLADFLLHKRGVADKEKIRSPHAVKQEILKEILEDGYTQYQEQYQSAHN